MAFLTVAIDGGMDLITAPQSVAAGRLTECQNYEIARQRGIRRMDGYERFDGWASPSAARFIQLTLVSYNLTIGVTFYIFKFDPDTLSTIPPYYAVQAVGNDGIGNISWAFYTGVDNTGAIQTLPSMDELQDGTYRITATPGSSLSDIIGAEAVVTVASNAADDLAAHVTYFNTVNPDIQPVPGQGNVNGVLWLKDKVYATRDYFAVDFDTGLVQPNIGDIVYIGASYVAATWSAKVAKLIVTSGSWLDSASSAGTGDAAGLLMVYNEFGTFSAATVKNHTQSDVSALNSTAQDTTSQGAGLYIASGGRGATVATQSWQWCDLGFAVQYKNGVVDFVNMNVTSTAADLSDQFITTGWKTATTPSTGQAGWSNHGTSYPSSLSDNDGTNYVDHLYFSGGNSYPTSGLLQLTGFGFTDIDIPPTASITGIQIEIVRGASGITAGHTASVVDKTLTLVGVKAYPVPVNIADTVTPWTITDGAGPGYPAYVYTTKDYGAPTTATAPTDLLGYNGITAADVKSVNFGINFTIQLLGTQTGQHIQAGITQVRMRVSYLPESNQIYFWNGTSAVVAQVVQFYKQSGDTITSNAAGTIYLHFVQSDGTIGGPPSRPIGAGEKIRTFPGSGQTPDGGMADGSTLLADSASGATMNMMDWSALLAGALQSDGSNAPPSKYQSITKNFYASTGYEAMYGVSGGGPAFYYDGIKVTGDTGARAIVPGNFSRILTGYAADKEMPRSLVAHQGHLMLGYIAGTVQQSDSANNLVFDPTLGNRDATEYGFSERVTGMASINGDSMAVWTQSTVQMIQGQVNAGNAYESIIAPTSGGIEYSIQPMANFMYADFRGITMIGATQKYGDFETGHVSAEVAPFLIPRLQLSNFFESANIGFINSVLIRNKNMARYFFADGKALSLTFLVDGENPQFTIQQYYKADGVTPATWDVVEAFTESTGRDRIFGAVADGTGYVYELERGNTFDGAVIPAYAVLVPDTAQSAHQNKKLGAVNFFGQAQDFATFQVSRSANYGIASQAAGNNVITETFGSGSNVPLGFIRPFVSYGTSELHIEGTAITLRFDSGTNGDASAAVPQFSHTIQAFGYDVKPLNTKEQ